MLIQPEIPAALLVPLSQVLLFNPALMLLVFILLAALLFVGRPRPTPTYTVVTVQPQEYGPRGFGCLPLVVLLLVVLFAIVLL